MNSSFQQSNYTPELQAAGLRTPNSIKLVYDVNPGGGGPIVKDKLWFYSAARWQRTQTTVAGLYVNKNAGDPTKWTYEPDLNNPAVLPLVQTSANTRVTWQITPRNKVAGFYEHQYRVWEQLGPTIALRVGHEVRLPEERIPHRQLFVADHQQVVVRCARLRHHPGLERPVSQRRNQPGVYRAAPRCVQVPDCGDRAGRAHPGPALSRRGPNRPGAVHPGAGTHCLRPGVALVRHGGPRVEGRLSRYVGHAPRRLRRTSTPTSDTASTTASRT